VHITSDRGSITVRKEGSPGDDRAEKVEKPEKPEAPEKPDRELEPLPN
jgi:hypothetical protein